MMDKVTETTYVIKVSDRQEPLKGRTIKKTQCLVDSNNNCNISIAPISVNSRPQVEQAKSFGVIVNKDRRKFSLENGTAKKLWQKNNLKQTSKIFF